MHPARVQHPEGVARAVSYRQHDVIGGDALAAGQRHTAQPPVFDVQVVNLALKTDLPAERVYLLAQLFHHRHEAERADVRLALVEDLGRRAGLDQLGEHLAPYVARIPDLAVELAVGKGAGPAFAELNVGFRIEHRLAPQSPRVPGALAHGLA